MRNLFVLAVFCGAIFMLMGADDDSAEPSTAAAPAKVGVVGKIPIREVSGLALRRHGSGIEILAIGDHDYELAVGKFRGGAVAAFDVINLRPALREAGVETQDASQWEGIKCDAAGRIFVLEENPGHVFVFDAAGKRLLAKLELHFHTDDDGMVELKQAWDAHANSRGEGLAFLEHGHLLVLKEKEPRRLIEFGPRGDSPVGRRLLGTGKEFSLPADKMSRMVPLAAWKFSKESEDDFPDLSDLDVDHEGRLWVLSDEGHAIGLIKGEDKEGRMEIKSITKIDGKHDLEKPEGLVVLGPDAALVACDTPERHTPLYSISLSRDKR